MTINPNDARAARSRRALMEASLELLLQKPNASMSDIAQHAGVGRATLYRHFDTREALIIALVKESLAQTEAVVAPIAEKKLTAKETLLAMLAVIVPLADRYHFLLSLWNLGVEDKEILQTYDDQLSKLYELIEAGKSEGSINKQLRSDWLVTLIDSLIYAAWWMLGQGIMSEAEVVEHIEKSLFQGIAHSAPRN